MFGAWFGRRGATLYLLVWALLGVALAGVLVSTQASSWGSAVLFAVPVMLAYAVITGFSASALCHAFPLARGQVWRVAAVLMVAAMLVSALWVSLAHFWNDLWQGSELEWAGILMPGKLLWMLFGLGVLLYAMALAMHYLLIEYERGQEAQAREMQSRMMAQAAELRMLRTQIDPHFLFNSLNSISALTTVNPALAREMTLELANFFRQTLGLEAHQKVTLDAEMRLTMHFLAVEKIRFGERLNVVQQIDPHALPCLLPPMLIQPLVENAVKHGIGQLMAGGTIRIAARCSGEELMIRVENDVDQDWAGSGDGKGIGLSNVRQRLASLYGHRAGIFWRQHADDDRAGFVVEIRLPAETTAD